MSSQKQPVSNRSVINAADWLTAKEASTSQPPSGRPRPHTEIHPVVWCPPRSASVPSLIFIASAASQPASDGKDAFISTTTTTTNQREELSASPGLCLRSCRSSGPA